MNGEHDKLRSALDDLQARLDELREVDPDVATHLDASIEQAKALLAGQRAKAQDQGTVIDQLREAMLKYEASHPTLAGTLGSVIDALGQMGI